MMQIPIMHHKSPLDSSKRVTLWAFGLALWANHATPALPIEQPSASQLLIAHARVLDVRTGRTTDGQSILIDHGVIARVVPDSAVRRLRLRARNTFDARGRLVTPAFVDAHFHTEFVLGDSSLGTGGFLTHLVNRPDSSRAYRKRIAEAYLPYGVTLVRDAGSATQDLPLLKAWMNREPTSPDLLPSGAQLVSPERGRASPPFQVVVRDSAEAAAQVRAYAALGFRNIKLYWRLDENGVKGGLAEANKLGLTATAHVGDGSVSVDRAMTLGVRHFEHFYTLANSVLSPIEANAAVDNIAAVLNASRRDASKKPGVGVLYPLEQWRVLGANNPRVLALIDRFRTTGSTLTPTLHIFAQRVGLGSVTTPPTGVWDDTRNLTPTQRARAVEGARVMAGYVAQMDARGVHLAVGSDTQLPGASTLDEILLLGSAGIPNWRVLRIATLYSAEVVGRGNEYGAIEAGRRADLLVFDADPLVDLHAVLGTKTVIKDGVIVGKAPR